MNMYDHNNQKSTKFYKYLLTFSNHFRTPKNTTVLFLDGKLTFWCIYSLKQKKTGPTSSLFTFS